MIGKIFTIFTVWWVTFYLSSKIYKYLLFKYNLQNITSNNVQVFIELAIPFVILFLFSFLPRIRFHSFTIFILLSVSLFTFGSTSPFAFIGF
ncbi:MAG: hypothetical protein ACK5BE_01905 [Alphaproteobacteria bacterium]